MSAVLMVSSAISWVPSVSLRAVQNAVWSCWRRDFTEPSITVSPTWATMPPSTVGSMTTLTSTFLPVACLEGGGEALLLVVGEGDGRADLGDLLVALGGAELHELVDDRRQVAGATGADHHRHERGGDGVGLAAEEVLDDLLAPAHREVRVGERGAQLVVGLEQRGRSGTARPRPRPGRPRRGRPRAAPRRRRACARRSSAGPSRPG